MQPFGLASARRAIQGADRLAIDVAGRLPVLVYVVSEATILPLILRDAQMRAAQDEVDYRDGSSRYAATCAFRRSSDAAGASGLTM